MKKVDWELREMVGKWMKHAYGTPKRKHSSTTSISSHYGASYSDTGWLSHLDNDFYFELIEWFCVFRFALQIDKRVAIKTNI